MRLKHHSPLITSASNRPNILDVRSFGLFQPPSAAAIVTQTDARKAVSITD
jgi:hypothetical protein